MAIEENKILVHRYFSDRLWLWQQLGVLPDIKEAIAEARARLSQ